MWGPIHKNFASFSHLIPCLPQFLHFVNCLNNYFKFLHTNLCNGFTIVVIVMALAHRPNKVCKEDVEQVFIKNEVEREKKNKFMDT